MPNPTSSRLRTKRYRDGLRSRGLRPVQIWLPDPREPGFAAEIERQCQRVNAADRADGLMAWVEDASLFDNDQVL